MLIQSVFRCTYKVIQKVLLTLKKLTSNNLFYILEVNYNICKNFTSHKLTTTHRRVETF